MNLCTYEVRGPYVTHSLSWWYVWEREGLGVPQVLSTSLSEEEALRYAEEYRRQSNG
jgi:hypothetical protein